MPKELPINDTGQQKKLDNQPSKPLLGDLRRADQRYTEAHKLQNSNPLPNRLDNRTANKIIDEFTKAARIRQENADKLLAQQLVFTGQEAINDIKPSTNNFRESDLTKEQEAWMRNPSNRNNDIIVNMYQEQHSSDATRQQESQTPITDYINNRVQYWTLQGHTNNDDIVKHVTQNELNNQQRQQYYQEQIRIQQQQESQTPITDYINNRVQYWTLQGHTDNDDIVKHVTQNELNNQQRQQYYQEQIRIQQQQESQTPITDYINNRVQYWTLQGHTDNDDIVKHVTQNELNNQQRQQYYQEQIRIQQQQESQTPITDYINNRVQYWTLQGHTDNDDIVKHVTQNELNNQQRQQYYQEQTRIQQQQYHSSTYPEASSSNSDAEREGEREKLFFATDTNTQERNRPYSGSQGTSSESNTKNVQEIPEAFPSQAIPDMPQSREKIKDAHIRIANSKRFYKGENPQAMEYIKNCIDNLHTLASIQNQEIYEKSRQELVKLYDAGDKLDTYQTDTDFRRIVDRFKALLEQEESIIKNVLAEPVNPESSSSRATLDISQSREEIMNAYQSIHTRRHIYKGGNPQAMEYIKNCIDNLHTLAYGTNRNAYEPCCQELVKLYDAGDKLDTYQTDTDFRRIVDRFKTLLVPLFPDRF